MKNLLAILLSMFVGISVVGCGSTECRGKIDGDLLCVYESGAHLPFLPQIDFVRKCYKNGKLHTIFTNEAAVTTCKYFGNFGRRCKLEYYKDGLRHCDWGPAVVDFLGEREWWLEGNRYYVNNEEGLKMVIKQLEIIEEIQ
jgi:hypothetical protein